ncbi:MULTISPECIES: cyclase family protein [unclassified Nocardioides]|uniref:cyclase family protein n=1 Tax=unclassified Nocardioides TaxID=2615069 RepID=UPI0009F112FC|nr:MULTISPECIES: cyclase family protein [unclassified Nocardioides]GAW52401.1 uncharacterized protein PD653B2_4756 [Nocardioides sp. PD653-B2]GAW53929.1 uncharacterized protein PD653_1333 [Nocardioides sp. PD653]
MAETGPYDGRGAASPQWWPSRYGPDDTAGSANELTPERTLRALTIPRTGEVVQLAQPLSPEAPFYQGRVFEQRILAHKTLQPIAPEGSAVTTFEEIVTLGFQVGTHLDCLGHVGIAGRHYNGTHFSEFFSPKALTRFGPSELPAWVVRGVLLDIAGLLGAETLSRGFVITPEHLDAACEAQDVTVSDGDALVLNTGWGLHWGDPETFNDGQPGIGWEAAHWISERRVSVVGADNWGLEAVPFEDPERQFVGHQHLLAETGTFIVENLRTQELVERGVATFLWMMSPLNVAGSSGSPVAPIAVI